MKIITYSLIFILVHLVIISSLKAGDADSLKRKIQISDQDTTGKTPIVEELQFYGVLRFIAGYSSERTFAIRNNASKMGFTSMVQLVPGLKAVAGLEVGVGLAGSKEQVIFHGDPGGGVGEIDNVFTSRLGYIGLQTKFGSITWGKQWSPYYLIAGLTDQFMAFGAEAAGAFPNYTDGGISGTGRSSNAFLYNLRKKWFQVSFQIQHRDITGVKTYPSTYCAAVLFHDLAGFTFGASYNKVRDGIEEPKEYEPKKNDEAAVFGVSWKNKSFRFAATYSNFNNHMTDYQDNYFGGWGFELYSSYYIKDSWEVHCGGNYLKPTTASGGDYLLRYLVFGTSYTMRKKILFFIEVKIDDSYNYDGSPGRENIFGFGMFYSFTPPNLQF